MNSPYARAVLRYWWIAVLGVIGAVCLAIFAVDRVSPGIPPKLTPRKPPIFVAKAELFVDSPHNPYLRTAITGLVPGQTNAAQATPDTGVLLSAANLYPIIIQSDQVTALREQVYGQVEGSVVAQAAFASASPYGSYKLSPIPIIDVTAYSAKPEHALKLAQDTVGAFRLWLTTKQRESKIPASDRVLVRELQAPAYAARISNSSFTLPAGVAVLFMGLAFGLIVLLDRWRGPGKAVGAGDSEPADAPTVASEPAVVYAQGAAQTSSPTSSTPAADY